MIEMKFVKKKLSKLEATRISNNFNDEFMKQKIDVSFPPQAFFKMSHTSARLKY